MSCIVCNPEIETAVRHGDLQRSDSAKKLFREDVLVDAHCEKCGSRARVRALAALLCRSRAFLKSGAKVLLVSASAQERPIYKKYFSDMDHVSLIGDHGDPDCRLGIDITDLPKDRSYDYVIAWNVIDYIPEAAKAFKAVSAVVRPGGAFLFYIMPYRIIEMEQDVIVVHRNALTLADYAPKGECTGIPDCRFNANAIMNWLSQAGFDPMVETIADDISPMMLDIYIGRKICGSR